MKIAMIGPRGFAYPAGIDRVATSLAVRLAKRGHEVFFYHRDKGDAPPFKKGNVPFIICLYIPAMRNKYLGTPVYAIFAAVHSIFQGFDIIHFQGLGSAWCAPLTRMFSGAKIVTTIHAPDWEGKKWNSLAKWVLKLSAKIAIAFSHSTTTVSESVKEELQKISPKHIHVIYNGISMKPPKTARLMTQLGLGKNGYILFLGRLTHGKGCEYLIEAYSHLTTDKKLVIAGDTVSDHEYTSALKKMGGQNVAFLGWVEGELKEEILSNAYIFVQPSDLEGLSGTLLEAMSYGLCSLASDLPSNKELAAESAVYFNKGSVEDLKNTLERLLGSPNLVSERGKEAREIAEKKFSWDPIVDKLERIYMGLVNRV